MTDDTIVRNSVAPENPEDLISKAQVLACPFCGGVDTHDPIHGNTFRIVCSTCGAGTDMYETPAQVIAAWNRRPNAKADDVRGEVTDATRYKWLEEHLGTELMPYRSGAVWRIRFLPDNQNSGRLPGSGIIDAKFPTLGSAIDAALSHRGARE